MLAPAPGGLAGAQREVAVEQLAGASGGGRRGADLSDRHGLLAQLEDVATMAFHGVPGCEDAVLTVVLDDATITIGATSAAASDLETAERELGSGPTLTALRHGCVVLVDDHRRDDRWPHVAGVAAAHHVRSTLSLPLLEGSTALGALTLHGRQPAAFGQWAAHVGAVLARQAAAAVSGQEAQRRAGARHAVETRIAQTLQRDLLPVLPSVPGLVTAGRYVGAEGGVDVGGDWYDVFPVASQAVGLVIGDVMGHGLAAAHGMSQMRTALRVCAHQEASPARALDRLDRLVSSFELALTTAVYGSLVPAIGGAELRYCNAGHPPPLLRCPDGRVSQLDGGASWLLGGPTTHLGPRKDAVVHLPAGAVLVLYTDGLVERRRTSLDHGIRRLRDALAGLPEAEPELLCDRLLDAVCDDGCSDDLALLAVQVT